jgi:hypothetical protein
MKKSITITYDVITRELHVNSEEFTTFEALGLLEGAKAMIINGWYEDED